MKRTIQFLFVTMMLFASCNKSGNNEIKDAEELISKAEIQLTEEIETAKGGNGKSKNSQQIVINVSSVSIANPSDNTISFDFGLLLSPGQSIITTFVEYGSVDPTTGKFVKQSGIPIAQYTFATTVTSWTNTTTNGHTIPAGDYAIRISGTYGFLNDPLDRNVYFSNVLESVTFN